MMFFVGKDSGEDLAVFVITDAFAKPYSFIV